MNLPPHFLLRGVTWQEYVDLSDAKPPAMRLTYLDGALEVVVPDWMDDRTRELLEALVSKYGVAESR